MFYAVANGRSVGVFTNWTNCKHSVQGFSGAVFKKFDTKIDAEAFIASKSLNKNVGLTEVSIQSNESHTDYYVYTDGACSKNGMRGASAGIGVYFGEDDVRNVSKRLPGKQTNNVAELTAIISIFPFIESDIRGGKRIAIVTDSKYSIKCASSYGERCAKNGWVDDIPNKELVRQIYTLYSCEPNIRFIHVKAHTGLSDIHSIGNHHADRLATAALEGNVANSF
jgi:ribonuclease HI